MKYIKLAVSLKYGNFLSIYNDDKLFYDDIRDNRNY